MINAALHHVVLYISLCQPYQRVFLRRRATGPAHAHCRSIMAIDQATSMTPPLPEHATCDAHTRCSITVISALPLPSACTSLVNALARAYCACMEDNGPLNCLIANPSCNAHARCSIMVINFDEFVQDTERVVREVLSFAGADPARYTYKPLPPGMKVGGGVWE